MAKGTKRASPGADTEKNPLQDVELSEEDAKKLQTVQREIARAELVLGGLFFFSISLTPCCCLGSSRFERLGFFSVCSLMRTITILSIFPVLSTPAFCVGLLCATPQNFFLSFFSFSLSS